MNLQYNVNIKYYFDIIQHHIYKQTINDIKNRTI